MHYRQLLGACVFISLFETAICAHAFDGNRKGFIVGGGIGPGLTSVNRKEIVLPPEDRLNKFALATDFRIGAGITEHISLYFLSKTSWYVSERLLGGEHVTVTHSITGVGATYHFASIPRSFSVNAAIGIVSRLEPFEGIGPDAVDEHTLPGLLGGIGYELSRNLSIELTAFGSVATNSSKAVDHTFSLHASLLVIAY